VFTDGGTSATSGADQFTFVAPYTLTPSTPSFSATHGTPWSGVAATFTSSDTGATAGQFTAVIDWGDGTFSVATIAWNGTGFNVSGGHTYASAGSFTVKIQITDSNGDSVTTSGSVTVSDARGARREARPDTDEGLPSTEEERRWGRYTLTSFVGEDEDALVKLGSGGDEQTTEDWLNALIADLEAGAAGGEFGVVPERWEAIPRKAPAERKGEPTEMPAVEEIRPTAPSAGVRAAEAMVVVSTAEVAKAEGGGGTATGSAADAVFAAGINGEGFGVTGGEDAAGLMGLGDLLALPVALLEDLFANL
jgi:hypothetical protein